MDEYFDDCDVAYTGFVVEDEAVDCWVSSNDSEFGAGALSTALAGAALPKVGQSFVVFSAIETLPFAISSAGLPRNLSFAFSLASAAEAASLFLGGVDDAGMPRNASNRRSNSTFRAKIDSTSFTSIPLTSSPSMAMIRSPGDICFTKGHHLCIVETIVPGRSTPFESFMPKEPGGATTVCVRPVNWTSLVSFNFFVGRLDWPKAMSFDFLFFCSSVSLSLSSGL
mmetsp:Transcript_34232/g.72028  ORF Transcript_34232/g.72028 Transcript_34232/m.72028 type:complete len:225 (-) Transcript_34232:28-702(-)|eukprot:CAMPEP_0196190050 /NCGR_PEP_ID=MMETSP0911-20130528/45526_1 /TAXON_ID=49265 /ORGANISM="Thalassiosira rotula, Strain GSO102" /LENGTH=224 /DNA_ID=CAMNT_0041461777 /DNA_START=159 /DNA_END=833 /DNA_ORIENTATION=-